MAIAFVSYTSTHGIKKPLLLGSWKYTTALLAVTDHAKSAMIATFLRPVIDSLRQHDEMVSNTVTIVGAVYASKSKQMVAIPPPEKRRINTAFRTQNSVVLGQMKRDVARSAASTKDINDWYTATLSSALLLSIGELLVTETGVSWRNWTQHIADFVSRHHGSIQDSRLDEMLLTFFRFADVLGAISLEKLPTFPEMRKIFPLPAAPELKPEDCIWDLNTLINILEGWAVIQNRASALAAKVAALERVSTSHDTDSIPDPFRIGSPLEIEGLEIVCAGSRLQRCVVAALNEEWRSGQDAVSAALTPYFHWVLAGLSQLFQEPYWGPLDCPLPALDTQSTWQEANLAAHYILRVLANAELEAGFLIPMVDFLGYEMQSTGDRQMVLEILAKLKARGFGVVSVMKKALRAAWQESKSGTVDNSSVALTLATDRP